MKYCYVCSPYRGNLFKRIRNKRYAKMLTKKAINMGYTPITPHLYITQVLNDKIPEEREKGLEIGLDLLDICEVILLGTRYGISEGMAGELRRVKDQVIIEDWSVGNGE